MCYEDEILAEIDELREEQCDFKWGAFKMKLYRINYQVWNNYFSDLLDREKLSVGNNKDDAIERVRQTVESDARNFVATEIESVFGYKIEVI